MRQIKNSLLVLIILAVGLPASAQNQPPTADALVAQASPTDLIGVGVSIINSLINPPGRAAEINAETEVKKAKIAADAEVAKEKLRLEASKSTDRITPVLDKWGVVRIACAPGLVFINGITTDTVCIEPNKNMSAGYYTYDGVKQQLVKNSNNVQTTQTTKVSNTNSNNSVESNINTSVNGNNINTNTNNLNNSNDSKRQQGF